MSFDPRSLKLPPWMRKAAQSLLNAKSELKIPLLSNLPFNHQLQVLSIDLLAFLLLALATAFFDNHKSVHDNRYVTQSSELLILSQRLAKDAQQTLNSNLLTFENMAQSRDRMARILELLDRGDADLPPTKNSARPFLNRLTVS